MPTIVLALLSANILLLALGGFVLFALMFSQDTKALFGGESGFLRAGSHLRRSLRPWFDCGGDDHFALKDAAIAAALDRSLHLTADRTPRAGTDRDRRRPQGLAGRGAGLVLRSSALDPFPGQAGLARPHPGGQLRVDLGNGVMIGGHYVEVDEQHVAFTWGRRGDPTLPSSPPRSPSRGAPGPTDAR